MIIDIYHQLRLCHDDLEDIVRRVLFNDAWQLHMPRVGSRVLYPLECQEDQYLLTAMKRIMHLADSTVVTKCYGFHLQVAEGFPATYFCAWHVKDVDTDTACRTAISRVHFPAAVSYRVFGGHVNGLRAFANIVTFADVLTCAGFDVSLDYRRRPGDPVQFVPTTNMHFWLSSALQWHYPDEPWTRDIVDNVRRRFTGRHNTIFERAQHILTDMLREIPNTTTSTTQLGKEVKIPARQKRAISFHTTD